MFKQSERICSAARSPSNHMKSPRKLILSKLRLYASFERRVNQNFAYELGSCNRNGRRRCGASGHRRPRRRDRDLPLTAPSPERLLRGCGDRRTAMFGRIPAAPVLWLASVGSGNSRTGPVPKRRSSECDSVRAFPDRGSTQSVFETHTGMSSVGAPPHPRRRGAPPPPLHRRRGRSDGRGRNYID